MVGVAQLSITAVLLIAPAVTLDLLTITRANAPNVTALINGVTPLLAMMD
jgi:hypothetical protein